MKSNWLLGAALAATALTFASAAPAAAATKFEFWYGLSGDLSERIQDLCKNFNASQADYEIVCVSQENYENNLQNTIAAFRADKQPTVTQISDGGVVDLMLSGAYIPVRQLMEENGYKIDWSNYFSGIASYFSTSQGELLSMPFNSSTAMFYYNTDALQKVGFEGAPQTWEQVEKVARDLKTAGYDCRWRSTRPASGSGGSSSRPSTTSRSPRTATAMVASTRWSSSTRASSSTS